MNNDTQSSERGNGDPDHETGVYDRWPYTNDLVAAVVLISVPILAGAHASGDIYLGSVPDPVVAGYLALVGIAASWTFGRSAITAWREIK